MSKAFHITSGDIAGGSLAKAGLPGEIFVLVTAADTPPQFWGDTTLWSKINGLADRAPPLVRIEGPADRLPQWESQVSLKGFRIKALPNRLSYATETTRV